MHPRVESDGRIYTRADEIPVGSLLQLPNDTRRLRRIRFKGETVLIGPGEEQAWIWAIYDAGDSVELVPVGFLVEAVAHRPHLVGTAYQSCFSGSGVDLDGGGRIVLKGFALPKGFASGDRVVIKPLLDADNEVTGYDMEHEN